MCFISKIRWLIAGGTLGFAVASGAATKGEVLQISEGRDAFMLAVPISKLEMSIPKNGFAETKNTGGGAAGSPRYFSFQDEETGVRLSGWFEAQGRFTSARKVWEAETKDWSRRGLPVPANVSFQAIGGWDAVVYDLPMPGGSNTHIRAHWVKSGTWIDVHLSMTSQRPIAECRARVLAVLKTFQVKERKD